MLNLLHRAFVQDFWLKVLALFCGIVVWFYVDDRLSEQETFVVPIAATDFELSEPNLLVSRIPTDEVQVTVRGPRARLQSVSPFKLRISKKINSTRAMQPGPTTVSLARRDVEGLAEGLSIEKIQPESFTVVVEHSALHHLWVKPRITGSAGEGYQVQGEPKIEPNMIEVRGPREINRVEHIATEEIPLGNATDDVRSEAKLLSYVQISPDRRIDVTLPEKQQTVRVTIPIEPEPVERTFTHIPVRWSIDQTFTGSVEILPSTVDLTVKGPVLTLQDMDREDIQVLVGISDLGADEYQDVKPYIQLPPGVKLVSEVPRVSVRLNRMQPEAVRRVDVAEVPVEVLVAPGQELKADVVPAAVTMQIEGNPQELKKLSRSDIRVLLPLKGLNAGEHELSVVPVLPAGIKAVPPLPRVTVKLSPIRDPEPKPQPPEADGSQPREAPAESPSDAAEDPAAPTPPAEPVEDN